MVRIIQIRIITIVVIITITEEMEIEMDTMNIPNLHQSERDETYIRPNKECMIKSVA